MARGKACDPESPGFRRGLFVPFARVAPDSPQEGASVDRVNPWRSLRSIKPRRAMDGRRETQEDVRAWVSEGGSLTQAAEHPSGSRVSRRHPHRRVRSIEMQSACQKTGESVARAQGGESPPFFTIGRPTAPQWHHAPGFPPPTSRAAADHGAGSGVRTSPRAPWPGRFRLSGGRRPGGRRRRRARRAGARDAARRPGSGSWRAAGSRPA